MNEFIASDAIIAIQERLYSTLFEYNFVIVYFCWKFYTSFSLSTHLATDHYIEIGTIFFNNCLFDTLWLGRVSRTHFLEQKDEFFLKYNVYLGLCAMDMNVYII